MTPADFSAWVERTGLSNGEAGKLIAAGRDEVSRWRRGERPVPNRVALIIELREKIAVLEAKGEQR